jgi:polysaccharide pyruvyl transferase WcaK-like protein
LRAAEKSLGVHADYMQAVVIGWYGDQILNVGDSLFKKAFRHLFPELKFTFTSKPTRKELVAADLVIIGGGSFLHAPINSDCPNELVSILAGKKVFYIGVGVETEIHPMHQEVMKKACLIAPRNENPFEKLSFSGVEVLPTPDIVYSLASLAKAAEPQEQIANSVLVLPNAELLPRWNDIQWKHSSWNYFKSEFSQFLDYLKETGHKLNFAPMCLNSNMHDLAAAAEIISQMRSRNYREQVDLEHIATGIDQSTSKFEEMTNMLSKYDVIISQRYHGAILAHIVQKPCLVLAHHDKLKDSTNSSITVPFYELSKAKLINAFNDTKSLNVLPIKLDRFDALRARVYSHIGIQCPNLSASRMEESR